MADLLDTIAELDLIDHVAPIQLAIRLLIPDGSRLLELAGVRALVGAFDAATLTHRWSHPDPRVDALQRDVASIVGVRVTGDRRAVFDEISVLAHDVFVSAFIDAMKTTLFVPIAFLAFTALTTLLIRRRKRPAAAQGEPVQEQKVAAAAG